MGWSMDLGLWTLVIIESLVPLGDLRPWFTHH